MSKTVKTPQETYILVGEVSGQQTTKMSNNYRVPDDEECYGEQNTRR